MTKWQSAIDASYLHMAAEYLKQVKEYTYSRMHLQPGYSVLDVGCGPGIDTTALARLVGSMGKVVGVDYDADMITEAKKKAEQVGCDSWCHHLKADATSLPFEADAFDACRSERMLQHISSPTRALAEMVRVTRPGGWIVALDTDWGTLSIHTPERELERHFTRAAAEWQTNGYIGRQLPALFREQQLEEITIEAHPQWVTNYTLAHAGFLLENIAQHALASGFLSESELQRLLESFQQLDAEGAFFAHLIMVLVAGRKKTSGAKDRDIAE
jgi:ubiquinone/menaquinone biosynthesis C-methylase UbiE